MKNNLTLVINVDVTQNANEVSLRERIKEAVGNDCDIEDVKSMSLVHNHPADLNFTVGDLIKFPNRTIHNET